MDWAGGSEGGEVRASRAVSTEGTSWHTQPVGSARAELGRALAGSGRLKTGARWVGGHEGPGTRRLRRWCSRQWGGRARHPGRDLPAPPAGTRHALAGREPTPSSWLRPEAQLWPVRGPGRPRPWIPPPVAEAGPHRAAFPGSYPGCPRITSRPQPGLLPRSPGTLSGEAGTECCLARKAGHGAPPAPHLLAPSESHPDKKRFPSPREGKGAVAQILTGARLAGILSAAARRRHPGGLAEWGGGWESLPPEATAGGLRANPWVLQGGWLCVWGMGGRGGCRGISA